MEISISGFDQDGVCHVLSHQRIWGSPDDAETWNQLSQLLVHRWRHPWGGSIGISATCIDSGFATEKVYDYCFARSSNRVYAVKGLPGNRAAVQRSTDKVVRGKSTRNSGHLWLVGTHVLKMQLFRRMQSGKLLRFSADLDQDYFDMLTSERITTIYRAGRRWPKFELISGRENHAFDTLVYAHAARASYTIGDWKRREEELRAAPVPRQQGVAVSGLWLGKYSMTNICCIGSVIDEQSREPVPVEIGRTGDGLFVFRFRGVTWEPELAEGRTLQRVFEAIQWRQAQAVRHDRPAKAGRRQVGPFEIGLNENGLWFIGTPSRYTYLSKTSLDWLIEATRRAINVPREPTQLAVQPDWGFPRDPGW